MLDQGISDPSLPSWNLLNAYKCISDHSADNFYIITVLTGKPGMLKSMGLQRVRYDRMTENNDDDNYTKCHKIQV